MALSKRLYTLFSLVEKGSIVADIGCDHGLLSIALVEENIASKVYACDLRKEPLNRAKEAIKLANLTQQITPILCNGLQLVPNDATTAVIAGMGGETIISILEQDLERLSQFHKIILQANTRVPLVRKWISDHNYHILQEQLVEEDHFYQMICFNTSYHDCLSDDEIEFGTNQKDLLFKTYCKKQIDKIDQILQHMPKEEAAYKEFQDKKAKLYEKLQ